MTEDSPLLALMEPTLASFKRRLGTYSWSEFKNWRHCPAKYLLSHHAVWPDDVVPSLPDDGPALRGIVVQRIFEAIVNERMFDREDVVRWIERQARSLIRTLVFHPLRANGMTAPRYWFRSAAGRAHLDHYVAREGLDPCFSDASRVRPVFVDVLGESFLDRHKSMDLLAMDVAELVAENLESFREHRIPLELTASELRVEVPLSSYIKLTGIIDFLCNRTPHTTDTRFRPTEGCVILDGKMSLQGAGVDEADQLMWYGSAVRLMYDVTPSYLGLWDWTQKKPHWYEFEDGWSSRLLDQVRGMDSDLRALYALLEGLGGRESVDLRKPYAPYRPSATACRYCPVADRCSHSVRS